MPLTADRNQQPRPDLAIWFPRAADRADQLTIRCLEYPSAYIRFYDRYFIDTDGIGFSVEAHAEGLHAHVEAVEVWAWDDADLTTFLTGLADDFRGWEGELTWHTNHLTVQAVYHSRGHVALTWTLECRHIRADSWRASLTTWQEAGAQMSSLANTVHAFLPTPGDQTTALPR